MKWILAVSVLLNVILIAILFTKSLFYYDTVRFWFMAKPEFGMVETTLKRILARAEFAEWFEFKDFTIREPWFADLDVIWKKQLTAENWHIVHEFALVVSKEVRLPCWPYKMLMDPADHSRRIGGGFGIGHSRCVETIKNSKSVSNAIPCP
jgi:uncharacterized membrane protein YbhN (UPF0104 family)